MGPNKAIGCNVKECRYHAKTEEYCALDYIHVSRCTEKADDEKDTECASFERE